MRVDQQIRLRDHIESDRSDPLADRIGELVMMAKEVQTRPHRSQNVVDHRLARIDPASLRMKRTWGLVCEKHVDARESLAFEHLVAQDEAAQLGRSFAD